MLVIMLDVGVKTGLACIHSVSLSLHIMRKCFGKLLLLFVAAALDTPINYSTHCQYLYLHMAH